MKNIYVVLYPTDGEVETNRAYLVYEEGSRGVVMYVGDDSLLLMVSVSKTEMEDVYTQDGGHTILGRTERGEIVIGEIYAKLCDMTGFEFLHRHVLPSTFEIDFELICE